MIFGHKFDFKDEHELSDEYASESSFYTQNSPIDVIHASTFSLNQVFSETSDWILMSGQETRYWSKVPFHQADIDFTWALEIKDVVTLIWDASDKKIFYTKGKHYTPKRLQFWVFHTFFPIVLEMEHIYRILHVGSVEIEGKAILFSAFSFGGKSTMTDYFIKKGHTMLSDDSVAIDKRGDKYYAIASYPFHRPYRESEVLGYPVRNFAIEPKPLHALYLLDKSEPDAEVEIVELKGIEKFKAFHYTPFLDFSFMKKERFDFFTEMAKHVSVYQVSIPWNLERLDEVYEAIVSNANS